MGSAVPRNDPASSLARDAGLFAAKGGLIVSGFGAELRRLRLAAGLGTWRLSARSGVSRSSIQYFESGTIRPRRCTIGALCYGLEPDDQERRKQLVDRLVRAAGGAGALAPDGKRVQYRNGRFERGLLSGTVPWPAAIGRTLWALQWADALRRQASALMERPGALDDAVLLDRADALLYEARRLRDAVRVGMVSVHVGGKVIRAGLGV